MVVAALLCRGEDEDALWSLIEEEEIEREETQRARIAIVIIRSPFSHVLGEKNVAGLNMFSWILLSARPAMGLFRARPAGKILNCHLYQQTSARSRTIDEQRSTPTHDISSNGSRQPSTLGVDSAAVSNGSGARRRGKRHAWGGRERSMREREKGEREAERIEKNVDG
ncbi:hypothetical protein DY000_02033255 [Brassica cretica]|uniref:Uncharacterized protein n=1 Tax=Brassica cretica TaxID=69181 RepID=A0ABQ7DTW9_BRACR|nr:hypothetical protein DY000_02033255 [Brassica cretica]